MAMIIMIMMIIYFVLAMIIPFIDKITELLLKRKNKNGK